jgi:hypothetical protein
MKNIRLLVSLLLAATVCLTGSAAVAKVFQFKSSNEYVVEKDFKLLVTNTSGLIQVKHRAGNKLVVEVIKEIDASSREEAEKLEDHLAVDIKADQGSVEIQTHYPQEALPEGFWERLFDLHRSLSTSVNFVITVPTTVRLTVSTTSGDVHLTDLTGEFSISATSGDVDVAGLDGDCEIQTTSGDLKLRETKGDVEINSTSSDVLVDNVRGNVNVQSTSGETEAYWLTGKLQITKTSGGVRVESVSGDIDINATSGNIEIQQREGGLFVSTASGDVHVRSELAKGQRYEVETISGNITFEVPAEMKGDVRLATVSGSINTDLAVEVRSFSRYRLEGRVRGEGPEVRLNSTSGDISLQGF